MIYLIAPYLSVYQFKVENIVIFYYSGQLDLTTVV